MSPKQRGKSDQNFNDLIDKFQNRVYGTAKGEWRLKLLKEDLHKLQRSAPMNVWDAGCGLGQMAAWFASAGHSLICCDISYKMLEQAKNNFASKGLNAEFHKLSAQDMADRLPKQNLIIFHAVLEWLAKPLDTLEIVADKVENGGYFSLLFYNYHSFIYSNTLKGGWHIPFVLDESRWYGKGKKLTPPHPQKPEVIMQWLESRGFEVETITGIRVFHDYITKEILSESDMDRLFELEYRYCRHPVYRMMGRYVHVLAKKTRYASA